MAYGAGLLTRLGKPSRVRIPLSPRKEGSPSGLWRRTGNAVGETLAGSNPAPSALEEQAEFRPAGCGPENR